MQRAKRLGRATACVCLAALALAWASAALADTCVTCHTTPAELVPVVRELTSASSRIPGKSEYTSGEG